MKVKVFILAAFLLFFNVQSSNEENNNGIDKNEIDMKNEVVDVMDDMLNEIDTNKQVVNNGANSIAVQDGGENDPNSLNNLLKGTDSEIVTTCSLKKGYKCCVEYFRKAKDATCKLMSSVINYEIFGISLKKIFLGLGFLLKKFA